LSAHYVQPPQDHTCSQRNSLVFRRVKTTEEELLLNPEYIVPDCYRFTNYYAAMCRVLQTNTFQVVIATDGTRSYTMFNYDTLRWTAGTASGGDASGMWLNAGYGRAATVSSHLFCIHYHYNHRNAMSEFITPSLPAFHLCISACV